MKELGEKIDRSPTPNYQIVRPVPVEFSVDMQYGFLNVIGVLVSTAMCCEVNNLATLEIVVSCADSKTLAVQDRAMYQNLRILPMMSGLWVRVRGTTKVQQDWDKTGARVTIHCLPVSSHTSYEDAARAEMQSLMEKSG